MLSKCANPSCRSSFRYLHQGKLFRFELLDPREKESTKITGSRTPRYEFFWLCDSCCSSMTLTYHPEFGVRTVPSWSFATAS